MAYNQEIAGALPATATNKGNAIPTKDPIKRKEILRKYNASEKGKACAGRYRRSVKGKAARKRYEQANPEKKSAHYYARRIERCMCSVEGCTELGERHHSDYNKPLDVEHLCHNHHMEGNHASKWK